MKSSLKPIFEIVKAPSDTPSGEAKVIAKIEISPKIAHDQLAFKGAK